MTSVSVRTSSLGARPAALLPSRSRTAVPESEIAARDFFSRALLRRWNTIIQYGLCFSCCFWCGNRFRYGFSTKFAFTTAVTGGNATQTAFTTRSAAGADILAFSEGAEIGESPDSFPPTTVQATYHTRQRTAHRARRIARHAATSAVPASAVLTTAVQASFC